MLVVVYFKGMSQRQMGVEDANGRHQPLETRVIRGQLGIAGHSSVLLNESFEMGKGVGSGFLECIQDEGVLQH